MTLDGPTCGKCGGVMTRENARIHPELFLHDSCLPDDLRQEKDVVLSRSTLPPMDLLDWFAGQAMAGLLANTNVEMDDYEAATSAYIHAAAMLRERARRASDTKE